jgi:hypothetical protein
MSNQISENPSKKSSLSYSKDTFSMYSIWFKDFFKIHNQTFTFISENLENYQKKFDKIFFEWLNQPKNMSKFMYEIKKEFIAIAEEVLLQEIMIEQYKKTEFFFIDGLLQRYLEFVADDDSRIEDDIDNYPDTNPDYSLLEKQPIIEKNYIEECIVDDNYYSSFFQ